MPKANSDNSTPVPAEATRRRFLSQAAGVAAGGTFLALAARQRAPQTIPSLPLSRRTRRQKRP
jgi:hypothetical protein